MIDSNFAAAVARDAAPDSHTLILEIGPGTGYLTQALLDAHPNARVLAIELDRGLAALLRETLADPIRQQRLTLLEGDALAGKHRLAAELVDAARAISTEENRPRRVLCANLPYNAATPVLANMAADADGLGMSSAVATIQLELASRFFAKPGESAYGALSVLMALRASGKILRRIGNQVFWPRPQVDSAVIGLEFRPWMDGNGRGQTLMRREECPGFQQFLQTLFSQRRKMLRAVIKPATVPETLQIAPNARAEDLPPETLLALFRLLADNGQK